MPLRYPHSMMIVQMDIAIDIILFQGHILDGIEPFVAMVILRRQAIHWQKIMLLCTAKRVTKPTIKRKITVDIPTRCYTQAKTIVLIAVLRILNDCHRIRNTQHIYVIQRIGQLRTIIRIAIRQQEW